MITHFSRILIVDDSTSFRLLLKRQLVEAGYNNFAQAENGNKALTLVKNLLSTENKVELIFCDWNMSDCNGMKFFSMLQADPDLALIPFIMVTAENEVAQILEAVNLGIKYYIVKPPQTEALTKKIALINLEAKKIKK
jgi:two-component system chemotaxis response regulator CheY